MDNGHFTETFNITVPQMEQLVRTALSHGGDYADLYLEYTTYNDLLLRDGEVTSGGFHIDYGAGIRVLKGEKTGYAYAENTDMQDLTAAAKAAAMIAGGTSSCPGPFAVTGTAQAPRGSFYPMRISWRDTSAGIFLPFLKDLEKRIFSKDSRVAKVTARLSSSVSDIMMYNSCGELACDTRPLASITASVIFSDGTRNESKSVSRSFRMGAEIVTDSIAEEMAEDAVAGIDLRFEARRPKGGNLSSVLFPLFSSYGKGPDKYCRYPAAYRCTLVLAACPRPVVYLQVIADGRDVRKRLRSVSYYIDVLYRHCKRAVLYQSAALDIESKVSFPDLDLSVGEFIHIDSLFYRCDDIFGGSGSVFHICGSHPRYRIEPE